MTERARTPPPDAGPSAGPFYPSPAGLVEHRLSPDHILAGLASSASDGLVPDTLGNEDESRAQHRRVEKRVIFGWTRPTGGAGPAREFGVLGEALQQRDAGSLGG
jgi:hypothetical protein